MEQQRVQYLELRVPLVSENVCVNLLAKFDILVI
jgi:hypothetical protein